MGPRILATLAVTAVAAAGCSSSQSPNEMIRNISVVGTQVGAATTTTWDGTVTVDIVPLDEHGRAVLDGGYSVTASVVSPTGVSATVVGTSCVKSIERKALAAGVFIDDSSSMAASDPDANGVVAPGRKATALRLINALQPGDEMLLADFFGTSQEPLRDLLCAVTQGNDGACLATAESFTSDKALLQQATDIVQNYYLTPIFEACTEMSALLSTQSQPRHAMILLSDGLPNNETARTACLDKARERNTVIYTIGFGKADVVTLRNLAEATGGSYAAATDEAAVDRMIQYMSYSLGSCAVTLRLSGVDQIASEMPVTLDLVVGASGAQTTFEFLTPRP